MRVKNIFIVLVLALLPSVMPPEVESASAGPTITVYQSPT
jgi:hypothetical protein